nr:hypothetical protein [Tanacetum cinerariifolium]
LQAKSEEGTLELEDPQELLGSILLDSFLDLGFLEYTNVTTGLSVLLSIGVGSLGGTIVGVAILVKGHTFPTSVNIRPVGIERCASWDLDNSTWGGWGEIIGTVLVICSIRLEGFRPSILLLTIIIVTVAIVVAVVLVTIDTIIGIVVIVVRAPSIIKLAFVTGVSLGLVFLLRLSVFTMDAACASSTTVTLLATNCLTASYVIDSAVDVDVLLGGFSRTSSFSKGHGMMISNFMKIDSSKGYSRGVDMINLTRNEDSNDKDGDNNTLRNHNIGYT